VEWKSGFLRRFPPDMCRMELRSGEVVCLTLRPLSKSDAGELHALIRKGLGLPPQTVGAP
jgi:hypothetical protein